MNRYLAIWGTLLALSGVVMHFLLLALGQEEFFMAAYYLPPAQLISYAIIASGGALLLVSLVTEWPRYAGVSNQRVSTYFGRIAFVNGLAAALFTAPMLDPSLELPILLTEWPGVYIVVAYFSFIAFGVFGMLTWSTMYRFAPTLFSRELFDRRSVLVQIALSEVGIYVVSTLLFLAGFTGATLVHNGQVGSVFVGASMEFSDIPVAVSIFLVIVSVFLGVATILTGKRNATEARSRVPLPDQELSVPTTKTHQIEGKIADGAKDESLGRGP